MNKKILLFQLKALLEVAPDFRVYAADSQSHLHWMNSVYSVIYQWKPFPAIAIASAIEFMPVEAERKKNIECIFNVAYHACSEVQAEIDVLASSAIAKKSSPENDFKTLLSMANDRLFIIDGTCDLAKLHFYINNLQELVHLRLLVKEISSEAKEELEKIRSEADTLIDIKIAPTAAETMFFVDELNCWGLIVDGYQADTLLSETVAPLPAKQARDKRDYYEALWHQSLAA